MFKNYIRKQVRKEMEVLKNEQCQLIKKIISDDLEKICIKIVIEIFNEKFDIKYATSNFSIFDIGRIKTVGGEFKERMIEAMGKRMDKECKTKAEDFIHGERFINEIISRINMKQLKS